MQTRISSLIKNYIELAGEGGSVVGNMIKKTFTKYDKKTIYFA